MPYATAADLVARFGEEELVQLADPQGTGAWDAGIVNQALADASAEMDAYLAERYAVPVPASDLVVRICCDIARYRLWEDRASDEVRRRYEDAVRMLRDIAAGRAALPGAAASASSPLMPDARAPTPRHFTERGLADFLGR